MKGRDLHLYGDHGRLLDLAGEYAWIGRAVKLDYRHLTVLSINPADLTLDRAEKKRKRLAKAKRKLEMAK